MSWSLCPCGHAVLGTEYTRQAMSSERVLNLCADTGRPAGEVLALAPLGVGSPVRGRLSELRELRRQLIRLGPSHRDQMRSQKLYSSVSKGPAFHSCPGSSLVLNQNIKVCESSYLPNLYLALWGPTWLDLRIQEV